MEPPAVFVAVLVSYVQAAELDVDTGKMVLFLLVQDVGCRLPGEASNERREACLLSPTHLVDPSALSGDEQGQGSRFGMWGCSSRVDRGTDPSSQSIVCPQGRRGFLHECVGHQAHHCLVSVHFSMPRHRCS